MKSTRILIGMGANISGAWGSPLEALERAYRELTALCDGQCTISHFYKTKPVGPANQPDYVNAVCQISTTRDASALLAVFKQLERAAGRGKGRQWGPRPLDLDLLDFKGRIHQWPGTHGTGPRRRLVLPHPELHNRAFVLRPLMDIAPNWRHPVLGQTAQQMLAKRRRDARAMIRVARAR